MFKITLFAIKLSSDFYKVQISTNYEKIILKFVVLTIGLPRSDTILPVIREITQKIKSEMRKRSNIII